VENPDLCEEIFQRLRNMRHVDVMSGELTLGEIQGMINNISNPRR
jgi:hypothetical protein